jgi:hypothetical protein
MNQRKLLWNAPWTSSGVGKQLPGFVKARIGTQTLTFCRPEISPAGGRGFKLSWANNTNIDIKVLIYYRKVYMPYHSGEITTERRALGSISRIWTWIKLYPYYRDAKTR